MNSEINYKKKYLELRAKYISDLDMAFRLGVEQGMQTAQQQQAVEAQAKAEQMQMQQQQMAMQAQGAEGGEENEGGPKPPQAGEDAGGEPSVPEAGGAEMQQPNSELDQHIGKLESMLGSNPSPEVQKSLQAIMNLRKAEKLAWDMKKGEQAIKGIAKALHKPAFKVGVQASHNLNDTSKTAVSMQHKIVNDIMKSWANEESKAEKDIKNILNVENLLGK